MKHGTIVNPEIKIKIKIYRILVFASIAIIALTGCDKRGGKMDQDWEIVVKAM